MNLLYKVWNKDCLILMIETTRIIPLDKPYSSWIVQLGTTLPSSEQVWAHSRILSSFFHTMEGLKKYSGSFHWASDPPSVKDWKNDLCFTKWIVYMGSLATWPIYRGYNFNSYSRPWLKSRRVRTIVNKKNSVFKWY